MANLPAVMRARCCGCRQILGKRLGQCQLPWGKNMGEWHQSPESRSPGLGPLASILLPTATLWGPHLPQRQDQQGQQ